MPIQSRSISTSESHVDSIIALNSMAQNIKIADSSKDKDILQALDKSRNTYRCPASLLIRNPAHSKSSNLHPILYSSDFAGFHQGAEHAALD